jgi:protein TonB
VNDAVDRLILERERLEHGFSRSLALSAGAHLLVIAVGVGLTLLAPRKPPIDIIDAFAVPLPPGGGGARTTEPPAPAPAQPRPAPTVAPEPEVAEPPKVLKPPKDEPAKNRLPEPDAKKAKPEKSPPPKPGSTARGQATTKTTGGAPDGTGRASQTPGLEFGPPGPGVPGGTDPSGDWYLAGVQRKIWTIWMQQVRTGFNQPVAVVFTIQADGSVTDVRVVESSGATLLDLAAQRAVQTAAPFNPLPRHYGTSQFTIQARFKPTP